MGIPKNPMVNGVASVIYERGGYVTAVCRGPVALLKVTGKEGKSIVVGKKVAGSSNEEEKAVGLAGLMPYPLQDERPPSAPITRNTKRGKALCCRWSASSPARTRSLRRSWGGCSPRLSTSKRYLRSTQSSMQPNLLCMQPQIS